VSLALADRIRNARNQSMARGHMAIAIDITTADAILALVNAAEQTIDNATNPPATASPYWHVPLGGLGAAVKPFLESDA
jgi:hypothetical protein